MNLHLDLPAGRIAYSAQGKGPALFLIHGFALDSTIWDGLLPELTERHRVLRIDLPGFGGSSLGEPYTLESLADVLHAVLEAEKISDCVLIGHSMGGYAGLAFAEKYPDKLRGLGLCHSHPFEDTSEKKDNRRRSIALIEKHGHDRFVREMIPNLFAGAFAAAHPGLISQLVERAISFPSAAYIAGLDAMRRRPDRTHLLKERRDLPWLFIMGEEDSFVPLDALKAAVHIPDIASIELLSGVGHMGMFEAPELIARRMTEFTDLCYRYLPL